MDTFEIDMNDLSNLGSFGFSIGSLSTGERKGVSVEKLASKLRNRNDKNEKIFGLNLYPLPDLQLNDEYIYDSEV